MATGKHPILSVELPYPTSIIFYQIHHRVKTISECVDPRLNRNAQSYFNK